MIIVNNRGSVALLDGLFASSSDLRATAITIGEFDLVSNWRGIAFSSPWFCVGFRRDERGNFAPYFSHRWG
jgi:hypothetical protein